MKVTIDIENYDREDFNNLIDCLKDMETIKKIREEFQTGELKELSLTCDLYKHKNLWLYLTEKNIYRDSKEFVNKLLDLLQENAEHCLKVAIRRLGEVNVEESV